MGLWFLPATKMHRHLVQDNLNIHSKVSLYEAFPAAEARRLVERFQWHYTPKHGSWLDLAESELGVLSSQCLDRRIPDKQTLIDEIAAWGTTAMPTTPRPTGTCGSEDRFNVHDVPALLRSSITASFA